MVDEAIRRMGQLTTREWEQISAYLDNQMSPRERAKFEQELASQLSLRQSLDEIKRTRNLLQSAPRRRAPRNFTLTPAMVKPKIEQRLFPFFSWASAAAALVLIMTFFLRFLPIASPAALNAVRDTSSQSAPETLREPESGPAEKSQPAPGITWGTPPPSLARPQMGGGGQVPGKGGDQEVAPKLPQGVAPAPTEDSPKRPEATQPAALPTGSADRAPTPGTTGQKLQAAPTATPVPPSIPAAPVSSSPTPAPPALPKATSPERLLPTPSASRVNAGESKQPGAGIGPVLGIPTAQGGQIIATSPVGGEVRDHSRGETSPDALSILQISLLLAAVLAGAVAVILRLRYKS